MHTEQEQELFRKHADGMIKEANKRAAAIDKQVKDAHAAHQAAQARVSAL